MNGIKDSAVRCACKSRREDGAFWGIYSSGTISYRCNQRAYGSPQAGLFDVSHMGEILCEGEDALANLQMILTNNFDNMKDGQQGIARCAMRTAVPWMI